MLLPKYYFFTKGYGFAKDELVSFELALRNASISPYNIVKVSSIIPPNCIEIAKEEGVKHLKKGQILFAVMSRNSTNTPGEIVGAAVGWARGDKKAVGYISEHRNRGKEVANIEVIAAGLAYDMLSSINGGPEGLLSGSVSQSAVGEENLWLTVVSAAVLII